MPNAEARVECPDCKRFLGKTESHIEVACHGWTIIYRKGPA